MSDTNSNFDWLTWGILGAGAVLAGGVAAASIYSRSGDAQPYSYRHIPLPAPFDGTYTSKFYVDDESGYPSRNVKIRYRSEEDDDRHEIIQRVIDEYPVGSDLADVTAALAAADAEFVPWSDGAPGYAKVYV